MSRRDVSEGKVGRQGCVDSMGHAFCAPVMAYHSRYLRGGGAVEGPSFTGNRDKKTKDQTYSDCKISSGETI